MKMSKTIIVNGHTYEGDEQYAKNCLNLAKEKFKKEKANAIYAVEKDNILEMKKETFLSGTLLSEASKQYIQQGFKVYSVRRQTNGT